MKGVIYRYNSPSGKIYVGQTMILERKRIDKHKFEAYTKKCNTPFGNAIRKYGLETIRATYAVIEYVEGTAKKDLKAKLTERENYWIQELDTFVPNGYNVKLTNQHTLGEYRNKEAMYKKISNTLKGKYMNQPSTSKPVIDATTGITYPSISEASRSTGIFVQSICGVLKGRYLHAGGHRFCYIKDDGTPDTSNLRRKEESNCQCIAPNWINRLFQPMKQLSILGIRTGKTTYALPRRLVNNDMDLHGFIASKTIPCQANNHDAEMRLFCWKV